MDKVPWHEDVAVDERSGGIWVVDATGQGDPITESLGRRFELLIEAALLPILRVNLA